jgi:NAD(P)-dependent dehydrogenase (short-subunit alcohol dehydrogenase family)
VAVTARSADELAETVARIGAAGGHAVALPADVTDRGAMEAVVAEAAHRLGPVDVLVNNAGLAGPLEPFAGADPEAWWRAVEVNLPGPALCARAVLPGMLARGRGCVINVTSGAGNRARPHMAAYVVSKAALTRLTEVLAAETRGRGVVVFAVAPGVVRTAMSEEAAAQAGAPEIAEAFRQGFAAGRDEPAAWSARLVVRLAAGDADALTGRYLEARYDLDELLAQREAILQDERYTLRLRT